MGNIRVTSTDVQYVAADPTNRVQLTHSRGAKVYYDNTSSVSSETKDGTLESGGAAVTFTAGVYLKSAGTSYVWVEDVDELDGRDLATQAELESTESGVKAEVALKASKTELTTHGEDTSSVHGITDTTKLAVDAEVAHIVNAKEEGCKGDGTTDDSTKLQEAITKAIELDRPLYLPPGEYKTTKELKAEANQFCMFGVGRESVIAPEKSEYNALTVGKGEEGTNPQGFIRDITIDGGNCSERAKTGVASVTGKAALRLNGMALFELRNVVVTGEHDIGFALVGNCYGTRLVGCRVDLGAARLGIYLPKATENGEDLSFLDCWIAGEVAAVMIASGKNHRFHGGQYTASRNAEAEQDERGIFVFGKDYLGAEGAEDCGAEIVASLEYFKYCWAIRCFKQVNLFLRVSVNSSVSLGLGFYKSSAHSASVINMHNCTFAGTFTKAATEMVVRTGSSAGSKWVEIGSSGTYTDGTGETNALWNPMMARADIPRSHGTGTEGEFRLSQAHLKKENEALKVSYDEGTNFRFMTPEGKTYASANTLTVDAGMTLAKITGTTEIKKITATFEGHRITLKFAENVKVVDGENLKLAGNFEATADDTLDLICDGTNWFEVGRSAN